MRHGTDFFDLRIRVTLLKSSDVAQAVSTLVFLPLRSTDSPAHIHPLVSHDYSLVLAPSRGLSNLKIWAFFSSPL